MYICRFHYTFLLCRINLRMETYLLTQTVWSGNEQLAPFGEMFCCDLVRRGGNLAVLAGFGVTHTQVLPHSTPPLSLCTSIDTIICAYTLICGYLSAEALAAHNSHTRCTHFCKYTNFMQACSVLSHTFKSQFPWTHFSKSQYRRTSRQLWPWALAPEPPL